MLDTDYDRWAGLARDRGQYDGEKDRIAETIIRTLDQRCPGLAQDAEALDVATPMTWERITGNWRGAYEAWLPTRGNIITHPPAHCAPIFPERSRSPVADQLTEGPAGPRPRQPEPAIRR